MKPSKKGRSVYAQIGVWREADGSIHFTIKGVKNGHIAVTADPSKRCASRPASKKGTTSARRGNASLYCTGCGYRNSND